MRTHPSSSPPRGPARHGFAVAERAGAAQISASSVTSARDDDGPAYYPYSVQSLQETLNQATESTRQLV